MRTVLYTMNKKLNVCFLNPVHWVTYLCPVFILIPLDYVTSQKYLGINITNDLSDDSDIIRQVKALYVRGNMLVHKFNHCSDDVKHFLFRSYCSNVYGSQLWSQYKKESYRKVNVAYNNIY